MNPHPFSGYFIECAQAHACMHAALVHHMSRFRTSLLENNYDLPHASCTFYPQTETTSYSPIEMYP